MTLRVLVVSTMVGALALAAPVAVQPAMLNGTWIEESGGPAPWGSRITTVHDPTRFTVIRPDGPPRSYALGGVPTETPLDPTPCSTSSRRAQADERDGTIVITESIVTRRRAPCLFGDDEEDSGPRGHGTVATRTYVTLATITVVSRRGERLVVEMTRQGPAGPVTSTNFYARDPKKQGPFTRS